MKIVYCANRVIYHVLPTALNSLLKNNKDNIEKIYLLIEDDSIYRIDHPLVEFININNYPFIFKKNTNCTKRFPYTAMTRCFLSKILDEDKVLYLDTDTTVNGDLSDLWNLPLGSNFIAAREESNGYFNSGVLLMNLKQIRESGYDDILINLLKNCKMKFPDQDAMNLVFKDRILPLEDKFNKLGGDWQVYGKDQEIVIRHYAGVPKPWKPEYASEKDVEFWSQYYTDVLYSSEQAQDMANKLFSFL